MDLKVLGNKIKKHREEKHIKQHELAEMIGVTTDYISKIETGKKCPALDTFVDILNALNVSADVILSDVLDRHIEIEGYLLDERFRSMTKEEVDNIYAVVETMINQAKKTGK